MKCSSPLSAIITPDDNGGKKWVKIIGGENNGNSHVPCGRCIGCRLKYSSDWGVRCYVESTLHTYNYFITLTYDEEHVPKKLVPDENGSPHYRNDLVAKHFTKFMKDLRRYYEYHFDHKDIRFYGSGEYGDSTYRPHFHILLLYLKYEITAMLLLPL
mgnify:CR=1 FL=1